MSRCRGRFQHQSRFSCVCGKTILFEICIFIHVLITLTRQYRQSIIGRFFPMVFNGITMSSLSVSYWRLWTINQRNLRCAGLNSKLYVSCLRAATDQPESLSGSLSARSPPCCLWSYPVCPGCPLVCHRTHS